MQKRRVVITGLGVVTSLGCSVEEMWQALLEGKSGIHPLSIMDTTGHKVHFGGDIPDFDPGSLIEKRELNRLDRFAQFALIAAHEAVNDCGYEFPEADAFRCGVILGSGIGGLTEIEAQVQRLLEKGPDRVSALTIPKLILNAAGANIAIRYRMRGPNDTVATACASATNAIGDAFRCIQENRADLMITGGAEAAITPMSVSGFANMKALSMRNDEPTKASRPFDADRNGFVLSEGAGILVLEDLEHAKARGAKIYAEVLGFGASCDGDHLTSPHPEGIGAAKAMSNALEDGDIDPATVTYINAHGTSTPQGDKAETLAIKNVYGDHAYKLSISSTKSQLGHSLGASGGVELVITVRALERSLIPPTINLDTPDPDCDLDYTPHEPRERAITAAMSNSFGFGGHNASVVIGHCR